MRLTDFQGEEALDLLADLMEPVAEIFQDEAVKKAARAGDTMAAAKAAIKNHKSAIIEIMARLDGKDVESYRVNVLTLPIKLLQLLNDPALKDLFTSQGQKTAEESSGSATENIEEKDG